MVKFVESKELLLEIERYGAEGICEAGIIQWGLRVEIWFLGSRAPRKFCAKSGWN